MDARTADPVPAASSAAEPVPAARAPRARRGPYRRLPVEQRREQLIAVALELFSRHAPEEVSLDDVAAAAEASRPLVYRYFPGGKQQLYEAALRTAAEELASRFVEPVRGTPTERLGHVLDRYFAFVGEHAAGYGALLRGGSVAENERTTAIVDEVRRAAYRSIIDQLGVERPGPRLTLLVRSWISVVEVTALTWLDDSRREAPPGADAVGEAGGPVRVGVGTAAELRDWLVDEFVVMFAAAALHDPQTERVLKQMFASFAGSGPGAQLVARLGGLLLDASEASAADQSVTGEAVTGQSPS
ncbi:TetR/AcrR family transcriptional regulator [Streptacidiphilus sp. P02-A3a]|uniref:TetR/AcrR family transcriptional regulator n=1 Tax=Streptacidiphilus sp. P02-A3a TaxID=2704468 RepID=UPI0015FA337E|nr:TetR/AcrR family transcriptional regulator [Streptacidiphilus sp. P02-A3a]QMU72555.1 TetR/AcrR family transcriptional regulator [Streptacidiphilus sp. P02-A3a]